MVRKYTCATSNNLIQNHSFLGEKKINKNLHQDKVIQHKKYTNKKIIYKIPTKHTAQVSDFSQLQVLASTSQ